MIYDRLRIVAFDLDRPFDRKDRVGRDRITEVLAPFGAEYAGWQSHGYRGSNPTHLLLLNCPTEEQIAQLLLFSQTSERDHRVVIHITREFKGAEPQEYSIDNIMKNMALLLAPMMFGEGRDASLIARSWSDLRIMQEMVKAR